METKLNPLLINRAVDIYAITPNVHHKGFAKELKINDKTLLKLRKDSNFCDSVYKRYLLEYESEIPDVLRALIREAKAGSVMTCRLILEHGNKLQKNINITSPFKKWLAMNDGKHIEEAEVVLDQLPPRTADNTPKKAQNELVKLDRVIQKKQAWNERRRELHKWVKRADAVGIKPLPSRRPTKGRELNGRKVLLKQRVGG